MYNYCTVNPFVTSTNIKQFQLKLYYKAKYLYSFTNFSTVISGLIPKRNASPT